jgi:SAM-dependent methyltransferase
LTRWDEIQEVNLLAGRPRGAPRIRPDITEADRDIAKQFGRDYFDGDRQHGYGGYSYRPEYWVPVVQAMVERYGIAAGTKLLDIGSGKGFLLHALVEAVPGVEVLGLDISEYGVNESMPDVRSRIIRWTAEDLPFRDGFFDVVVSINTIHNLKLPACEQAVREIQRVKRPGGHSYIQVDSWFNEDQRLAFERWQLTALTYFDPDGWKDLFARCGYTGDCYWTITE